MRARESRLRYLEDEIYTLVGTIMIAINPFMEIDAIYGPEVMKRYAGKELGAVKAHLYAMGKTASDAPARRREEGPHS